MGLMLERLGDALRGGEIPSDGHRSVGLEQDGWTVCERSARVVGKLMAAGRRMGRDRHAARHAVVLGLVERQDQLIGHARPRGRVGAVRVDDRADVAARGVDGGVQREPAGRPGRYRGIVGNEEEVRCARAAEPRAAVTSSPSSTRTLMLPDWARTKPPAASAAATAIISPRRLSIPQFTVTHTSSKPAALTAR
ncbi:MAG TPA: hypothetical protein VGF25_13515 [Thermoleophilaceae bacterium]|jgi:hypothetical protein